MNERSRSARPRGTGSIYRQKNSAKWWIQYYRNGFPHRESTQTDDRRKAEKFLQKRLAEVATNNFIGPRIERIKVCELADDLLREYRINKRKSLDWAERRWRLHLQPFFGMIKASQVGTELLSRYVDERQQADAENATVNRELAFLKRAFQIGLKSTPPKVYRVPGFPALAETNVRKGFLEDAEYEALAKVCAEEGLWLRGMLEVAYNFGWRKSELLGLRVRQVDLASRAIRLEVGETKNSQGRTVKMPDAVQILLAACVHGKAPDDYVFTRTGKKRVKDFRKTWQTVCERAKVPGLLLHDLRRTGARNLRRLGLNEGTIMKIGGWKTRSVFMRYDIVSEADLDEAARRLNEKREALAGHRSDIVSSVKGGSALRQVVN